MKQLKLTLTIIVLFTAMANAFSQTTKIKPNKIITLWVNAKTKACNLGELNGDCLLVKYSKNQKEWERFSSINEINGFEYREGFEYVIKIRIEKIRNLPADASNLEYTLIKLVSKKKMISQ